MKLLALLLLFMPLLGFLMVGVGVCVLTSWPWAVLAVGLLLCFDNWIPGAGDRRRGG